MFSWLKNHLVPHRGNGHRPHLLHGEAARYVVLFLLLGEALAFFGMTSNFMGGYQGTAAVLPAVLGDLTNAERAKESLGALADNPVLDRSAQLKAEDMAAKGYFAHVSPEGKTPWYWLDQVGYDYEYAGENLAINFSDSEDVTRAWMDSPTHRANIEKAQYTEVGTGVAEGIYEGVPTVFVAQVYARPAHHEAPVSDAVVPVPAEASAQPQEVSSDSAASAGDDNVLGASVSSVPAPVAKPTFFQKAAASPRHAANALFLAVGILVALVMIATVAVQAFRGKLDHYDLLTNGILVLAMIGALALANYYLSIRAYPLETSFAGFDSDHNALEK
ncbi:MAG TPA: CAP domain-containing protein [Candidatus Paceibacterota bacterium]|nr:CAP domain-containing protein [Candidatus Paceibacterota bacterium]